MHSDLGIHFWSSRFVVLFGVLYGLFTAQLLLGILVAMAAYIYFELVYISRELDTLNRRIV